MQEFRRTTQQRIRDAILLSLFLGLLLGAGLLARDNFRQGRGDRRGAFRLALFVFAANLLSWLIAYRHTLDVDEVLTFFFLFISRSLTLAGLLWLLYLALEPYVRRRWPDTIISWSRILSGSLRDPLVGRDLLVGVLFGIGYTLLFQSHSLVRIWRGWAPYAAGLDSLPGVRDLISVGFLDILTSNIFVALLLFFLLFLLRALTRRQWLAASICVLIFVVQGSLIPNDPLIGALFSCLAQTLTVIVLLRFGLVALATGYFVSKFLVSVPLTTDFSIWYAGSALAVLFAVLSLAGYAPHTSLGGQKVFAGKLLDE